MVVTGTNEVGVGSLDDPTGSGRSDRETSELLDVLASARRRRRWPMALGGLVVGAGAMFGLLQYVDETPESTTEVSAPNEISTAEITSTDFVWFNEYSADLGYGDSFPILASNGGVVTDVAPPGSVLERGDVLARVDGQPVLVWFGELPAWRTLNDAADPGADVRQAETNLVLLGYDEQELVDVDETYLWGTTAAVYNLEAEYELDLTGAIDLSRVVFVPGPVVVTDSLGSGNTARSGSPLATVTVLAIHKTLVSTSGVVADLAPIDSTIGPDTALFTVDGVPQTAEVFGLDGGDWMVVDHHVSEGSVLDRSVPVVTVGSNAQRVRLDVPADEIDAFTVGDDVEIEFADGAVTTAELVAIDSVAVLSAEGQGDAEAMLGVTYVLTGPSESIVSEGPVTIRVVDRETRGVTVVPVRALVTLADGGYALEVVQDETTTLVAVEVGEFKDGLVEVSGSVEPGQDVVVP